MWHHCFSLGWFQDIQDIFKVFVFVIAHHLENQRFKCWKDGSFVGHPMQSNCSICLPRTRHAICWQKYIIPWFRYAIPFSFKSKNVCWTQMCVSMPTNTTCFLAECCFRKSDVCSLTMENVLDIQHILRFAGLKHWCLSKWLQILLVCLSEDWRILFGYQCGNTEDPCNLTEPSDSLDDSILLVSPWCKLILDIADKKNAVLGRQPPYHNFTYINLMWQSILRKRKLLDLKNWAIPRHLP